MRYVVRASVTWPLSLFLQIVYLAEETWHAVQRVDTLRLSGEHGNALDWGLPTLPYFLNLTGLLCREERAARWRSSPYRRRSPPSSRAIHLSPSPPLLPFLRGTGRARGLPVSLPRPGPRGFMSLVRVNLVLLDLRLLMLPNPTGRGGLPLRLNPPDRLLLQK